MNILNTLYESINSEYKSDNPFETDESDKLCDDFAKSYIYTIDVLKERQDEMWEDFLNVLMKERETAFKIGFKTATSLLMSCNSSD